MVVAVVVVGFLQAVSGGRSQHRCNKCRSPAEAMLATGRLDPNLV